MPGIINAHKSPIRPGARFIRLTHTGLSHGSLFLSDLDTEENKRANEKHAVYVSFKETVDILMTDRTLTSYQQGSIRGFLDAGFLNSAIVQNLTIDEGEGGPVPLYEAQIDDELILIDTSLGDVIVNLPDIFSLPFPENRTPEGTTFTIKKVTPDSNRIIVTATPGQSIEGSLAPMVITGYLDSLGLQSDDAGNWWTIYCCKEQPELLLPFLSHYNTTDGENDASVSPPVFAQAFIGSPEGEYGVGGLDDENLHQVARAPFSYVNIEEATQLEEGTITVEITYLDAAEVEQTVSFVLLLDGTEKTETGSGITISITGLISDFGRRAGFVTTTIDPLAVPGLGTDGGLITRIETRHDVAGDAYPFVYTDPVFVDAGPTPPVAGAPALEVLSTVDFYLSGVPHATNGTTLRALVDYTDPFNQTYVAQPFRLNASAQGFGNTTYAYNAAEITTPSAAPSVNDDASLDVTLTLSGNGTCSENITAQASISDPFNTSGNATGTLNDVLVFNRTPNATRNSEDFRGEGRRLLRSDDFTLASDRDAGNWDSLESLVTYDDGFGLQVIGCRSGCDGLLVYPGVDYTSFTPSGPDYTGLLGEAYEGATDVRWYYRHLSNSSGTVTHSGGVLRIELCSGVLTEQDLTNDRLFVEVMLANPSASPVDGGQSDWLSLNRPFNNAVFDPVGATRVERGCLTNTSETNQATSPPEFGFTLSSNAFPYFTSPGSNFGVRVRIGMRLSDPFQIRSLRMVGW